MYPTFDARSWVEEMGLIPLPRDARNANRYYLDDAENYRNLFLFGLSDMYSFDKASENDLNQLGDYKKRFALWYKYYQLTFGDGQSSVTPLINYEEVQQYKEDIDAAIESMLELIAQEVADGGDILTLERFGDRSQGNLKLLEYWQDVVATYESYKLRKWRDKFQKGEE